MQLTQAAVEVLTQLKNFTAQLSDNEFKDNLPVLFDKSVGKHIRHILEFFNILIDGYARGTISYESRAHDLALEKHRYLALKDIDSILDKLTQLTDNPVLTFTADYARDAHPMTHTKTSFLRELIFNIEHTVHHMALLKIATFTNFPTVQLPENFGIAHATVCYEASAG